MNCQNCGNILKPEDKFCPVCGVMVSPSEVGNTASQQQQQIPQNYKKSKAGIIIVSCSVAAVLMITVLVIAAVRFLTGTSDSEAANGGGGLGSVLLTDNNGNSASGDNNEPGESSQNVGGADQKEQNVSAADVTASGTVNRQEGRTIYTLDGALYNDKGSYNMDFYEEDGYLRSSFSKGNSSMTIVDQEALYYVNSALDVEVMAVGVQGGGISYNGDYMYYVTSYSNGVSELYIVDRLNKKKYYIDDQVSSYNVIMSPGGKWVAYSKYENMVRCLYVAGIGQEPVVVNEGYSDLYAITDEGELLYGIEDTSNYELFDLYAYDGKGESRLLLSTRPNKIYTNNSFDQFVIRTKDDYYLYYFDYSMTEPELFCEDRVDTIFTGKHSLELDYPMQAIDCESLDGMAFVASDLGTCVFAGKGKGYLKLTDRNIYELQDYIGEDSCVYAFYDNREYKIYRYELKNGKLDLKNTYDVNGSIGDISSDETVDRIWYCNRDGQLYEASNDKQQLLAQDASYSYSTSTIYNGYDDCLYFIKDSELCYVSADGTVTSSGIECEELRIHYNFKNATGFIDSDNKKFVYIGGYSFSAD